MFYLVIDQHAKQLTVNLRDAQGNAVLRRQVSTRPQKVLEFFEQLTARCAKADCGFWAIVEVCGFNDWLIKMRTPHKGQCNNTQIKDNDPPPSGGLFLSRIM